MPFLQTSLSSIVNLETIYFPANCRDDCVHEPPFLGQQTFAHRSNVMGIALDDLKVFGCLMREDGGEFCWSTAKGDASMTCCKRLFECWEADSSTGTEKNVTVLR